MMPNLDETGDWIGIFGGSFNPPHIGHVLACHYALAMWPLNRLMVVPGFQHPFGKPLEDFSHRLAMTRLAIAHLGAFAEVSDLEAVRGGVSYTIDTVREVSRRFPKQELRLVVGGDVAADGAKWKEFEELTRIAPLLIIPRLRGSSASGADSRTVSALPEVSSSDIRRRLREEGMADGAIPLAVQDYITQHHLYQSPTGNAAE